MYSEVNMALSTWQHVVVACPCAVAGRVKNGYILISCFLGAQILFSF